MKLPRWTRWIVSALIVLAMLAGAACGGAANEAPVISSLTASPPEVAPGDTSTITCVASDPDDDTLTYSWTATGGTISGVGSTVTWIAPSAEGTFTISVTVDDGRGETDTDTVALHVVVVVTTGSIDVQSNPAGAEVYLDGSDTGNITPYVISDVEAGSHTVGLTYAHYKDRQETVTVTAGETTYINWALTPAPTETVTIQPSSTAGKDSYVYEDDPTDNYETNYDLYTTGNTSAEDCRAYLQFDCSGLPPTAIVTSAKLGLYYYLSYGGATAGPIGAYRVTSSWSEGSITWNLQPTSATTPVDTRTVPASATDNFRYWYIDDLVQGWIDGSIPNNGVMLMDTDESTSEGWKGFRSSDYATAGQRPKLVISYYDPADP